MSFIDLANRMSVLSLKNLNDMSPKERDEVKWLEAKLIVEFGEIDQDILKHQSMKEKLTGLFIIFAKLQMRRLCDKIRSACDFNCETKIPIFQPTPLVGDPVVQIGVAQCSHYHILLMSQCEEQYCLDILPTIRDLTAVDGYKGTYLMNACKYGYEELALKILVTGKCDYKSVNDWKDSAFTIACNKGLMKVISHFVDVLHQKVNPCPPIPQVPLFEAVLGAQFDTVKYLVEHKADVNFKTLSGMTSLMLSCKREGVAAENIGLYLIDCGAEVKGMCGRTVKPKVGSHIGYYATAIMFACVSKHEKLVKRLYQMGCTFEDADHKGLARMSEHKDEIPIDPAVAKIREAAKEFYDRVVSGLSVGLVSG